MKVVKQACSLPPQPSAPTRRAAVRGYERRVWGLVVLFLLAVLMPGWAVSQTSGSVSNQMTAILVMGAPGQDEYASNFVRQVSLWEEACARAQCRHRTIGLETAPESTDLERLKQAVAEENKDRPDQFWLVLIGHGTYDGKEARFNLRGPDLTAGELAEWLKPFRRPLALINTTASSAPFLNQLSATNRVIITATRGGEEQNFTRFGQFFAQSIASLEADLDKDGQVSLLESFLSAARSAVEFYKLEGRLATEHALLDDNGDGKGTPAEWFRGLRATRKAQDGAPLDGMLAHQMHLIPSPSERRLSTEQRTRRDELERQVFALREKKAQLGTNEYYAQLETILLELARMKAAVSTEVR
jgi:hypothetical protein